MHRNTLSHSLLPPIHESGNTIGISQPRLHKSFFSGCAGARAATQLCLFVCVCEVLCKWLWSPLVFKAQFNFPQLSPRFPLLSMLSVSPPGRCWMFVSSSLTLPHVTCTYTQFPRCKLAHVWAASSKKSLVVTLVLEHLCMPELVCEDKHATPRRSLHLQRDRFQGCNLRLWLVIRLRRLGVMCV